MLSRMHKAYVTTLLAAALACTRAAGAAAGVEFTYRLIKAMGVH